MRGETALSSTTARVSVFSIHSPLAGRDRRNHQAEITRLDFQSTRPLRGETAAVWDLTGVIVNFQSTRPLRGETGLWLKAIKDRLFSIHSPLAGRDASSFRLEWLVVYFQSTRPLRGETLESAGERNNIRLFNPLAPCGARQCGCWKGERSIRFSIHSPLAGRDR